MFNDRPVQRGYPNRARIYAALRMLHKAQGRIPPFPETFWERWGGYDPDNAAVSIQALVRKVARRYALDVGTIVVTFMAMPNPGRVELHNGNDFFVELSSDLKDQPRTIGAVLGHEVAHIFLHRHGLAFPETLDNEVLTDVTSAMYGFGALMLDTFVQTETRRELGDGRVQVTRHERAMGYLTPDELGWVLAKADFDVGGQLESDAARRMGKQGRNLARMEASCPPLAGPFWRRWLYAARRWWAGWRGLEQELADEAPYAFGGGKVTFRCPSCTQKLRVPTHKQLTASCGCCGRSLACVT